MVFLPPGGKRLGLAQNKKKPSSDYPLNLRQLRSILAFSICNIGADQGLNIALLTGHQFKLNLYLQSIDQKHNSAV